MHKHVFEFWCEDAGMARSRCSFQLTFATMRRDSDHDARHRRARGPARAVPAGPGRLDSALQFIDVNSLSQEAVGFIAARFSFHELIN